MFLVQLVYVSKAQTNLNERDIEEILTLSKMNNERQAITGLLSFNHSYFLQCLEGSRSTVNDTYQKILKDPRHSDAVILSYESIDYRYFGSWSMAYVPSSSLTQEMILTYGSSQDFDPYKMSGESALLLLTELAEHIPTV
jgi:hypothetical protein